MIVSRQG